MENKIENQKFPDEISSKYEIIQEIGRGAFSIVYKVKSREDNNIYCLKKINMRKTKDKENEINILSNLNHPNLIKFYYSYANEEGIYIIMEFCEYGDLYSLLQSVKKKKVYVNEDIIWDVAIQTLLGLEYLHSKQIIHRDIKLLNLFMTKDKKIKIGDMGMSVHVEEGEMIISRVGTPLYIAPELVKKEKYDYKIDIWSFGCSLYHLAKTSPPFNDENLIKLGNSIINEQPAHLPSCYSSKLYEFILLLMTKNKNKRPSAQEALKMIPDKIKNKLNNKILDNNNKNIINKSNSKDGHLTIKNKNISNNNDSKNDSNNNDRNTSTKNSMKIIEKNNENININNKINKGLVSGQTFYQFFKNNPDKKRSNNYFGINNLEINNNNNLFLQTKNNNKDINNKNKINNNDFLLSKTMIQMKDNFYKIKTPGKLNVYINESSNNKINKSLNNIKIINHSNSKLYKNNEQIKNIEEDKKEYSNVNTYINTNEESNSNSNKIIEKESNKKIININLKKDINPKIKKEEELNNLIKNEEVNNEKIKNGNDRYNIQMFNQKVENNLNINNININKISMKYNKFDNYLRNNNIKEKGGGFDLYSKSIHNAMKTFLIKDNINDKNKIINSMQFYKNRKYISNNSSIKKNEYNLDNISNENNYYKEDIIFPLIIQPQNNYKNKNNSTNNKYRRTQGLQNNFRKTVNSNNFRNKLTIHDLK